MHRNHKAIQQLMNKKKDETSPSNNANKTKTKSTNNKRNSKYNYKFDILF
jgi:hypothetical protein